MGKTMKNRVCAAKESFAEAVTHFKDSNFAKASAALCKCAILAVTVKNFFYMIMLAMVLVAANMVRITLSIIAGLGEVTGTVGLVIAVLTGSMSLIMGGLLRWLAWQFLVEKALQYMGLELSSSQEPDENRPTGIKKLTGTSMVWRLYTPEFEKVDLDIIFFHGLQLGNFEDAFWKTWLTRDEEGKVLEGMVWPIDLLAKHVPQARILSVSYNTGAVESDGRVNLDTLVKNLVGDITHSAEHAIGQGDRKVLFVGHSLGGIIIKKFMLCAWAESNTSLNEDTKKLANKFIANVKGMFYYGTPHGGSRIADWAHLLPPLGPMVGLLKTLSVETAIINEEFRRLLSEKLKVRTCGMGESEKVYLVKLFGILKIGIMVVEESSSQLYSDDYRVAMAVNHFDVCKPKCRDRASDDAIFYTLIDYIATNEITKVYTKVETERQPVRYNREHKSFRS